MRESGSRNVSGAQSLFVDDLKQYQESYQVLKDVNKIIVKGNHDTGTCNGVSKCAEITFEYGKIYGEGKDYQLLTSGWKPWILMTIKSINS